MRSFGSGRSHQEWHNRLASATGPGHNTTAKCYRLMRAILNTAVIEGHIKHNPCAIQGAGLKPHHHDPSSPSPRSMSWPMSSVHVGEQRCC